MGSTLISLSHLSRENLRKLEGKSGIYSFFFSGNEKNKMSVEVFGLYVHQFSPFRGQRSIFCWLRFSGFLMVPMKHFQEIPPPWPLSFFESRFLSAKTRPNSYHCAPTPAFSIKGVNVLTQRKKAT